MFDRKTKIPMTHVNLRLPKHVLAWYRKKFPSYTTEMRDRLMYYYHQSPEVKENNRKKK
jgi:hypothetical protein